MSRGLSTVLIICPTEYGGHIEHAADLAMALARHDEVGRCLLVSRPGAVEYLGNLSAAGVEILEVLPARRASTKGIRGILRPAAQVLDLVAEHRRLRTLVSSMASPTTVLFESPKYPYPSLAVGKKAHTVLFVHNAKPHVNVEHVGIRQRVLSWLERRCIQKVNRLVTHGATQLATLAETTLTPATAVPLPTLSALQLPGSRETPGVIPGESYALCIGELRPNKGIELAIAAAAASGVHLLVAGKSESPVLAQELAALAHASKNVELRDEFLPATDFDALIRGAALVVLPYTHFDAQSGILSKAIGTGRPVLAADLPALRDQAREYPHISYTNICDPVLFSAALSNAFDRGTARVESASNAGPDASEQWDAVASAVMGEKFTVGHAAD